MLGASCRKRSARTKGNVVQFSRAGLSRTSRYQHFNRPERANCKSAGLSRAPRSSCRPLDPCESGVQSRGGCGSGLARRGTAGVEGWFPNGRAGVLPFRLREHVAVSRRDATSVVVAGRPHCVDKGQLRLLQRCMWVGNLLPCWESAAVACQSDGLGLSSRQDWSRQSCPRRGAPARNAERTTGAGLGWPARRPEMRSERATLRWHDPIAWDRRDAGHWLRHLARWHACGWCAVWRGALGSVSSFVGRMHNRAQVGQAALRGHEAVALAHSSGQFIGACHLWAPRGAMRSAATVGALPTTGCPCIVGAGLEPHSS